MLVMGLGVAAAQQLCCLSLETEAELWCVGNFNQGCSPGSLYSSSFKEY